MRLLPANLAHLVKCAATDTGRYSMTGVQLSETAEGYTAVATDGKRLAVVTGTSEDAKEYPIHPTLAAAPNTATTAVIPSADWTAAFKAIPRKVAPILSHVAVVMSDKETTYSTTDLKRTTTAAVVNVEGRFPDYTVVIPKDAPAATVRVNAEYLTELCEVASRFTLDDTCPAIELELRGTNTPIVVRSGNGSQTFLGLVMPLDNTNGKGKQPATVMLDMAHERMNDCVKAIDDAQEKCKGVDDPLTVARTLLLSLLAVRDLLDPPMPEETTVAHAVAA